MKSGATLIERRIDLDKFELVRFQLTIYRYVNRVKLNDTEVNLLSLIGEIGRIKLQDFGKMAVDRGLVGSWGVAVNALRKLERSDLFIKDGYGRKELYLNPKLGIVKDGNVVINLRVVKLDERKTKNSGGNIPKDSKKTELAGAVH